MNAPLSGSSRTIGVWAAAITVVIWSMFIVIARASAQHRLAPLDIVFARLVGAGLVLLPLGWWMNRTRQRAGGARGWLGLSPLSMEVTAQLGLTGGLGYALLVYAGFFYAPATHASVLLTGSLPLWTALLAYVLLGERITRRRGLCLALIFAGDVLVGLGSFGQTAAAHPVDLLRGDAEPAHWKGHVLFVLGALMWSLYGVLLRRHAVEAVAATAATTVFAFLVFVPLYGGAVLLGVAGSGIERASLGEFAFQAAFQGIVSVVLAGITFSQMVRSFGPVRSTMITAIVPGLSAVGAVVFLGEPMRVDVVAGLALVTLGILLAVRAAPSAGAAAVGAKS